MTNSKKNYTKIDSEVQDCLINDWLPRLHNLEKARKPKRKLMVAIILIPLVIALIVFIIGMLINIINEEFKLNFIIISIIGGYSAVCFVYLGKLQSCDDTVLIIDMTVKLGYIEPLLKVIAKISCYGSFQSLIKEMGNIFKDGKKIILTS